MKCTHCGADVLDEDVILLDSALWHLVDEAEHDGPSHDIRSWQLIKTRCGPLKEVDNESDNH